ncbi:MAG: ATP-dependent helicase [Promethearchaeota archaeon]
MIDKKEEIKEEFVFEFYDENEENMFEIEQVHQVKDYSFIDFQHDLNEEQLEIINSQKGPVLVIAGAGSGKTRTIVYSVAKLLISGISPEEIMLVTFTNKAAEEMIKRVEILLGKRPKGIWAGTFHSIGNRFLRRYSEAAGLKPNYTIMDESDAKALMKLSIQSTGVKDLKQRFPTALMSKDILSYSINCNKPIKEVISWKYDQFNDDEIISKLKDVYRIYERKKAEDGLLDFDDLLVFWNKLLDEKFVAQLIARKIKHVLVDEYQDTNYIQDQIVRKIVSQNPERNVMAVGDDAQSIYAFRGANFQNIIRFKDHYPGCKVYKITYNYRSTPEILILANDSIRNNQNQFKKEMKAVRSSGTKPFHVFVGTEEEQARFIANQVLRLREEGCDLENIAVLYRAGHHSMKIELELQSKKIPYEVRSGLAFFERAHIKDLLAHLRVIDNPHDELSWARIFNIVPGIGTTSGAKIFEKITKTDNPAETLIANNFFSILMKGTRIQSIGKKNLVRHVKYFVDYGPDDEPNEVVLDIVKLLENHIKSSYKDWENRIEDLNQLSIYTQNYPTIRKLLETLSLNKTNLESKRVRSGDNNIEEKPMILSTIHRAKGLEWRHIFIPMLCQDYFPSSRVLGDEEAFEEERRVFYVAATRAKDNLYLISPAVVQSFRGVQAATNSQFVSELLPTSYRKAYVDFEVKIRAQASNSFDQEIGFKTGLDLISEKSSAGQKKNISREEKTLKIKKGEFKSILDYTEKEN